MVALCETAAIARVPPLVIVKVRMHHLTSGQNSNTNSVSNSNENPTATGPLAIRLAALKVTPMQVPVPLWPQLNLW